MVKQPARLQIASGRVVTYTDPMTKVDIISDYSPILLDIENIHTLKQAIEPTHLLVYGEIHGIRENAAVIYTICRKLNIRRVAIEASPTVKDFIQAASDENYDFSMVDDDIFDSSILSLEVAKTLATLLRSGNVEEIVYIDTYFDTVQKHELDHPDSPQKREQALADNILSLDRTKRTLCLMGQWHTQPKPVTLIQEPDNSKFVHYSALHRIRQIEPDTPFVYCMYGKGQAYNDGRVLDLPVQPSISDNYTIVKISDTDYALHVPEAHRIVLE